MIEFSGEISQDGINLLASKSKRGAAFGLMFGAIILGVPSYFFRNDNGQIGDMMEITLLCCCVTLFIAAILFVISFVPNSVGYLEKKGMQKFLPQKVTILEDGIEIENGMNGYFRYLSDVKKVIDYGNGYFFVFYFPQKIACTYCQKNLLTKGSIEEFEKIFEGLIVRSKRKIK